MRCPHQRLDRRTLLGLLGVGLAAAATGCATGAPPAPGPDDGAGGDPTLTSPGVGGTRSRVLTRGPAGTRQIAITVDDGYCNDCVAGYVDFAQRSGTHLSLSPNGLYAHAWEPHAPTLRPLIEAGQVQIINHTFSHPNLTKLPTARVRGELERNEAWIGRTFATTTRPYYRPPFGTHNPEVDATAAGLGLDQVVQWNGSFGDATLVSPGFLLAQARRYLQPGVILLGHANHPTVLGLFDQITQLIAQRQLQPVTLDEMFGTHRAPGPH